MSSALHRFDTPTRTLEPRVFVFGVVMTKQEALRKALDLSERGDHAAAARVLDAAGLWPHDLIEWAGQA